ncbi:hypothetical protein LPJ61_001610 [Coemansia biformis]|uniref:Uncharacterized protein n=1 Tax=Coemansia biformis TaxID=1286918 RepID=A0A9W7YGJ6_9FUNG|nr:hypothetical protein LPJ61_001610 [Coemansia biformis]
MLLRLCRVAASPALRPLARGLSGTCARASEFPLTGPSWSVRTLLRKPDSAAGPSELDCDLSRDAIVHLYSLSGLRAPDPVGSPHEFAQVSDEINRLRDFLSHLRAAGESGALAAVEPLERIAEPVSFTASDPDGGLATTCDPDTRLGHEILRAAKRASGPYFVVEA